MLSQVTALTFVYFKDQNGEQNTERFIQYCIVIGILNFLGLFLNAFEQHPRTKHNSFRIVVELGIPVLGLVPIVTYFINYLEFSMISILIMISMISIWTIECLLYYTLSEKGIQSMLSLCITTNALLIFGDIALRGSSQISTIFDYSSINFLVLCAQFSWSGDLSTKKPNSLFNIISRQDCFRLIVYFLIFNIVNNTIRTIKENQNAISPTLAIFLPYIWATINFNKRKYRQAFGLFMLSIFIYFPMEIQIKYSQQRLEQTIQL
ncbi:unnamed protein product (macronuclear) [Paramecium tetraurelia]|uniref:Uncharacterized protein n=1 Tax=Paramecium tetraurelia TaxID=5888 RepID=A0C341_PARTE|nr:uncharacterized protein GSPATT00034686001 [Paramecium tetraurelia]CAK65208.1 unnamed protein product [Paramecium tetraurelia]|eukprot:XP_001432605.1 hypothetical protein (macronuclear) [Paramecium tetraurelia strain d4-2]